MARKLVEANASPKEASTPKSKPRQAKGGAQTETTPRVKKENIDPVSVESSNSKKRKRTVIKKEEDIPSDSNKKRNQTVVKKEEDTSSPAKKRKSATNIPTSVKKKNIKPDPNSEEILSLASKSGLTPSSTPSKSKSPKSSRFAPGVSPYPSYSRPTAAECKEVVSLLSKTHGKVNQPKRISAPSLTSSGCGEVPSVLDALIRTRLSAATTNSNSSRAFQGLVKKFGTLKSGIGKGSVDWNKVRLAPREDVFEAIKVGGLAGNKSRDIQDILQLVYEEGQTRSQTLKHESDPENTTTSLEQVNPESTSEKHQEVLKAESHVLSLDHLHLLPSEQVFDKLTKYPGIGPKTASCVLLFCLQRPSFAVDTHVFRLCQYLSWTPPDALVRENKWPKVGRESCYAHCDVRIPDEYKYALHYLMIKHGKTCGRCRAATGMGSEGWKKGCPIEHLVKRHGAKKGGLESIDDDDDVEDGGVGKGKGGKRKSVKDEDEDMESVDGNSNDSEEEKMSMLGSDSDEDDIVSEDEDNDDDQK